MKKLIGDIECEIDDIELHGLILDLVKVAKKIKGYYVQALKDPDYTDSDLEIFSSGFEKMLSLIREWGYTVILSSGDDVVPDIQAKTIYMPMLPKRDDGVL